MQSFKNSRATEDIKRELTDIFREIKDPRIDKLLSIVRVELSGDFSVCKVYVSSLSGIDTAKQSAKALAHASGFIKHLLGTRLRIRKIPEFTFIADNSIEYGAELSKLINRTVSSSQNTDDGEGGEE